MNCSSTQQQTLRITVVTQMNQAEYKTEAYV